MGGASIVVRFVVCWVEWGEGEGGVGIPSANVDQMRVDWRENVAPIRRCRVLTSIERPATFWRSTLKR